MESLAPWAKWAIAGLIAVIVLGIIYSNINNKDASTQKLNRYSQEAEDGLRKIDESVCKSKGEAYPCDGSKSK